MLFAGFAGCRPKTDERELRPQQRLSAEAGVVVSLGHGTFLTKGAQVTAPSLELILNTQRHYIEQLEGSDAAAPLVRSRERIYAEVHDPVLANAAYLERLISVAAPPYRATLDQINRALRRHYRVKILGDRIGHPFSALTTTNGGSTYRQECIANGVPVPANVLDEADSRWTNHGLLANPFLEPGLDAEVWTYKSEEGQMEPNGLCMALPRWNSNDKAELLGLICLGRQSSKVCFFDNPTGTQFPRHQAVAIENMLGGADLDANGQGVCTDCHAGENPFVVHPAESAFAAAKQNVGDVFPLAWPEPIVSPSWPQNPPPINRLGPVSAGQDRCDSCHTAVGPGGRLPLVSNAMPGYCARVLGKALLRVAAEGGPTMPPGSGTYTDHADWLLAACDLDVGSGQVVPIDPPGGTGYLSPPAVEEPVYACASQVEVTGARLHATLKLYVDGQEVASRIVGNPYSEVFTLSSALQQGEKIKARQIVGMDQAESNPIEVRDHTGDFPQGLPPPEISPTTVHACGQAVAVQLVRGASLQLEKNGTETGVVLPGFTPAWRYVHFTNTFAPGDALVARQRLCGGAWSGDSETVVVGWAPLYLPVITFNPPNLIEGQELVWLENILHSAFPQLDETTEPKVLWDEGSWPLTWGGTSIPPVESQHEFVPTQVLCNVSSEPPPSPPPVLPCSGLEAPIIAPPHAGDSFVVVLSAVPGATIRVLDATSEIGGGAGWIVRLSRALNAGEVIQVVQEVGGCTGSQAYSIPVGEE